MPPFSFWKFPVSLLLTALLLGGCGTTSQDLKQEYQDDVRGTREKWDRLEKSYESHQYFGYSSPDANQWNTTDWTLWMDTHGGGP